MALPPGNGNFVFVLFLCLFSDYPTPPTFFCIYLFIYRVAMIAICCQGFCKPSTEEIVSQA